MEMIVIQLDNFLDQSRNLFGFNMIIINKFLGLMLLKWIDFWIQYNQSRYVFGSNAIQVNILARWIRVIQWSYQLAFVSCKFDQSLRRSQTKTVQQGACLAIPPKKSPLSMPRITTKADPPPFPSSAAFLPVMWEAGDAFCGSSVEQQERTCWSSGGKEKLGQK